MQFKRTFSTVYTLCGNRAAGCEVDRCRDDGSERKITSERHLPPVAAATRFAVLPAPPAATRCQHFGARNGLLIGFAHFSGLLFDPDYDGSSDLTIDFPQTATFTP